MKLESETRVYLNEDYKGDQKLSAKEGLLVDILVDRNIMSIKEISGVLNQKNVLSLVKTLLEKEIVFVEEKIRQGYKEKMQHFVRLNPAVADEKTLNKAFDQLENAPKQLELLMQFIKAVGANSIYEAEIQKSILLKEAGTSASVFQSLIDKKILVQQKKMVDRLANHEEKTGILLPLIDFQSKALEEIKNQWKNNDVTLLHGVTSSGKTEIYIQLINEQVQQGKQVLYLLPEIALTTQIINRLKKAFGNKTGIYHSKFSDNERYETWKRVISEVNSYQVILGVRSSVFLPFRNLGLVIVDEEHENTYKQYNPAPRYNARDTAIVLAAMHGAKVLLGTATPSLESYFNSKIEKYGFCRR